MQRLRVSLCVSLCSMLRACGYMCVYVYVCVSVLNVEDRKLTLDAVGLTSFTYNSLLSLSLYKHPFSHTLSLSVCTQTFNAAFECYPVPLPVFNVQDMKTYFRRCQTNLKHSLAIYDTMTEQYCGISCVAIDAEKRSGWIGQW